MAGVAIDPVVFDQGGGVDAATLAVEGIGGDFGKGAGEDLGGDHRFYHKTNVL